MYYSIQTTIKDQTLSIWDAEFRIRDLEDIKSNKTNLDKYLKFSDDLDDFYICIDEYIDFLTLFIGQHKDYVKHPQFPVPIECNKNSIHHRIAKRFDLLNNELLPVSQMPKSFYMDDKT